MKTIFKVAIIAALWIILINPANLPPDTEARLQVAHALWTNTDEIPNGMEAGTLGVGGKRYYAYDPGQSLLMLPADWVGTQLHNIAPKMNPKLVRELAVSFLIVIPLNILVIVSSYWLLRLFDFDEKIAGVASIIFLLGTTVLHYAQIFQQNNLNLLCALLGYACALAYIKYRKNYYIVFSGLAIGYSLFTRSTNIIHAVTVFGFFLSILIYNRIKWSEIVKKTLLWSGGVIPFIFFSRLFNYLRFGSFTKSGAEFSVEEVKRSAAISGLTIPDNYPFNNPPHIGIWGVLFSPSKSIFIYDPLLLPCLILGISLYKKLTPYIKIYLISAIFNLVLHIVLTSRLDFWHGDGAWAARYHVTSVHLILLPLIALLIGQINYVNKLKKLLIVGLIALGILVQIPSLIFDPSVNSGWVNFAKPETFLKFRLADRVESIGCLLGMSTPENCDRIVGKIKGQSIDLSTRVHFWPLKFSKIQTLLWIVWGLIFIVALGSTVSFIYGSIGLKI